MSDPAEILKRRLESIFEGAKSAQGLHFFCQIGGALEESGMTTLQIAGEGWVLLSFKQGEERDLYSVQLTERDYMRVYEILLKHAFWSASPQRRPPEDDEVNIHLRLSDQHLGTWNGLQFWDGDMKEFPVLRELMYRLVRLIRAISKDGIDLPDWEAVA